MKICIVTTHLLGIGEDESLSVANTHLAELLSEKHTVEILLVANPHEELDLKHKSNVSRYQKFGISIFPLEFPHFELHTPFLSVARSFLVYMTLKNKTYDAVFFHDFFGLGYYSMLAKSLNLAFDRTQLILNFYGPASWRNYHNQFRTNSFSSIAQDFVEKRSCLMADHIYFPTRFAQVYAEENGFIEKDAKRSETLLYPFGSQVNSNSISANTKKQIEFCFFGNIETRTGTVVFLEAIAQLVHFEEVENAVFTVIGCPGVMKTKKSLDFLEQWSLQHNIPIKIVDNFQNDKAIAYMKNKKAIAILPYLDELAGVNLVECIKNEIPFICSDVPAFLEVLDALAPKMFWTFVSGNKENLAIQIKTAYKVDTKNPKMNSIDIKTHSNKWLRSIERVCAKRSIRKLMNSEKLSICIIFFDRPEFLVHCLNSITPILPLVSEILIYINSDDKEESKKLIDKIKTYPKLRCVYEKQKVSPGFAQNVLTREARSDSLLFLDDDNVLDFKAFKRLWINLGSGWDVICCTLKKFHSSDLEPEDSLLSPVAMQNKLEKISYAHWLPTGSNIPLSLFHNHIGDNNFLIKKAHLIAIGGVNETMLYNEDAELIIRSVYKNGRYFLSPESFIFYRKHGENLSSAATDYVSKDIKAIGPLLKAINSESLLPIILMTKALSLEKDRNPDGDQLGQIELAAKYRSHKGAVSKESIKRLKEIFKNQIRYNEKKQSMTCELLPYRKGRGPKGLFPDKTLHFIFYSESEIEIIVNDAAFTLKAKYNAVTIRFDQKKGIRICAEANKIDFVEVERPTYEYRL